MPRARLFGFAMSLLGVAAALTAATAGEPPAGQAQPARAEVGAPAPRFALRDLPGFRHDLAALRGRIVVLEWIAPGCPWTAKYREHHPVVPAMARRWGERGVAWLTVASADAADAKRLRGARGRLRLDAPVLFDPDARVAQAYGADRTPFVCVIDAEGVVRYMGAIDDEPSLERGVGPTNYLERALRALHEGSFVQVSMTTPHGRAIGGF